jgi:hypothetical protein
LDDGYFYGGFDIERVCSKKIFQQIKTVVMKDIIKAESIEAVIEFLEAQGIKTKHGEGEHGFLNRIIEFEIEGSVYFIEWWINQSYFKLKNEFSTPYLPFKYMAINPNSPTENHHDQLCFYDVPTQGDNDSIFYNPIPFGCMKIPFNRKK